MTRESYCFQCNKVKYARAHHCKICKTCIVRMDHHCPWVANCVGQQNHKFFILFLLYDVIAISFAVIAQLIIYYLDYDVKSKLFSETEDLLIMVCCVMGAALVLAIGFLFYFQVTSAAVNVTTVEHHIPEMHTQVNNFATEG